MLRLIVPVMLALFLSSVARADDNLYRPNKLEFTHFALSAMQQVYGYNEPVFLWPSTISVCAYGATEKIPDTRLALFLDLVEEATSLRFQLAIAKRGILDCARETIFFLRIHDGENKFNLTTINEVSWIFKIKDYRLNHDVNFDPYGMFVVFREPDKQPASYVSVNTLSDKAKYSWRYQPRAILQQELFQTITAMPDIAVERRPMSLLEEFGTRDLEQDGSDKFVDELKQNVSNMCLYDLMLLMSLYPKDDAIRGKSVEYWKNHLDLNIHTLWDEAVRLRDNPKFADLFDQKC